MLLKLSIIFLLLSTIRSDDLMENSTKLVRNKRGFNPWGFFEKVFNMKRILDQVTSTTGVPSNDTTIQTTTEKFRISRAEFAKILERNNRGLKKLYQLELNDALNQSRYSIQDYKREYQNAIKPINVGKNVPKTGRR